MATLPEAAEALGLHPRTLHTQIKLRRIHAHKMGGRWYITSDEIERYRRESLKSARQALEEGRSA